MTKKTEATEVFRQFAWHLAGKLTLASAPRRQRPVRPVGKRR